MRWEFKRKIVYAKLEKNREEKEEEVEINVSIIDGNTEDVDEGAKDLNECEGVTEGIAAFVNLTLSMQIPLPPTLITIMPLMVFSGFFPLHAKLSGSMFCVSS